MITTQPTDLDKTADAVRSYINQQETMSNPDPLAATTTIIRSNVFLSGTEAAQILVEEYGREHTASMTPEGRERALADAIRHRITSYNHEADKARVRAQLIESNSHHTTEPSDNQPPSLLDQYPTNYTDAAIPPLDTPENDS